jgi:hypothetical protein
MCIVVFHLGRSCTVCVLICTVVVLYCFVMCVCVCVWCVCVGVGFVICVFVSVTKLSISQIMIGSLCADLEVMRCSF